MAFRKTRKNREFWPYVNALKFMRNACNGTKTPLFGGLITQPYGITETKFKRDRKDSTLTELKGLLIYCIALTQWQFKF